MFKYSKNVILRFKLTVIFFFTVWGILIIAKGAMVMFKEKEYWSIVKERFVRYNVTLKAGRGNILSDKGELLASSLPRYQLFLDFMYTDSDKSVEKKVQHDKDSLWDVHMNEICNGLHEIFPNWSVSQFKTHLRKGRQMKSRYYKLYPQRISYAQYKRVKSLPLLSSSRYKSGLCEIENIQRERPFGSLAKRTLGALYAANDSAYCGLEHRYDSILRGKNGIAHRQKIGNKYLDIVDIPAENGMDIQTTLNVEMQDICENALLEELKRRNALLGIVILMEVKTGDIKGMVNMTRIREGEYEEIENNALCDLREPGSIFKTVAMSAALEDRKIAPNDSLFQYNGRHIFYGKRPTTDASKHDNGSNKYSATEVLKFSSNIGMGQIINNGYKKDPKEYTDRLYSFGITDNYHLLAGEATPRIKNPKDKSWSMSDLVSLSYGYASQMTSINMLNFYNTIANDGVQMKPRLIKNIQKEGTVVSEFSPIELRDNVISEHALSDIKMMLQEVVNGKGGTGAKAKSSKFLVAGKTGTARISKNGGYDYSPMEYLLSFCGYFPAEAPRYSCIVQIVNRGGPASGGATSGVVFGEIAERVMAKSLRLELEQAKDTLHKPLPRVKNGNLSAAYYLLDKLDIKNEGEVNSSENSPQWGKVHQEEEVIRLSKKEITENIVPDLMGMGAKDAVFLAEKAGLYVSLHGRGKVTDQSLSPGKRVSKGSNITLILKP